MFALTDTFISQFEGRQPEWGPLGYVTYKRTYSRTKEDGLAEEFWETLRRVVEGTYQIQEKHCRQLKLPWSANKAQRSAQEMYQRMWGFKFLPPGRGLWAMGTSIVDKLSSSALQNCAFTSTKDLATDFSGPFCFLMDMSMLGVGVGFDTLGAGSVVIKSPKLDSQLFVVEDSREGWVALVRKILDSYVGRGYCPVSIDDSGIRPAGTPLRTFGGVAAGPDPLRICVADLHRILSTQIGQTISSTAIVDLMNIIGKCVVSGNVRRSAEVALGGMYDTEFLRLKDKEINEEALISHRWASNNSVFAELGADYSQVSQFTVLNGEPGYVWMDNVRQYGRWGENGHRGDARAAGLNPCLEQTLEDRELCTLVETFPSRHDSLDDFKRTLKFAYLYGKTVTLIPSHDERSNAVMMRNRRIGTSQSGIVQSFQKIGRREHFRWCDEGYKHLRALDEKYSDWLCVPRSIKITTVKPSGTVSLLPGVTPGIHYPHSEYYFRTIRFSSDSPLLVKLAQAGYRIESDKYSPNTSVVYFAVREEFFGRAKDQVSLWEQLENVAQVQQFWSDNGVSCTVTFNSAEANDIKYALELYESRLKAISFLPLEDHGYEQAPYQTISKNEFEEYVAQLAPIDWDADSHEVQDAYCDGDACLIPKRDVVLSVAG